jgi:hypothetical protein
MAQNDSDVLLARIDERVAGIMTQLSGYHQDLRDHRDDIEALKKRVYTMCGGLLAAQVVMGLFETFHTAMAGRL